MGIIGSFEGYISSPLYLYNNGNWGGVSTTGVTMILNYRTKIVYESDRISLKNTYGTILSNNLNTNIRLNETVDLSRYNFIKVSIKLIGGFVDKVRLGITTSASASSYTAYSDSSGSGYIILNISSYSGFYYIYLQLIGADGFSVQNASSETYTFLAFNQILLSNN